MTPIITILVLRASHARRAITARTPVLFRAPTGLAVGLARKESRYDHPPPWRCRSIRPRGSSSPVLGSAPLVPRSPAARRPETRLWAYDARQYSACAGVMSRYPAAPARHKLRSPWGGSPSSRSCDAARRSPAAWAAPSASSASTRRGRLTVRERIDRLFDAGTFHETGSLAGRGTLRRRRRARSLPAREHGRRQRAGSTAAAPSSRPTTSPCAAAPPTRPSGRRWCGPSAPRTSCACRWCAWSTARAAGAASRRSRDGLLLRAAAAGLRARRREPRRASRSSRRRSARSPASAPRASWPRTSR